LILTLLDSHRRRERHHGEYAGVNLLLDAGANVDGIGEHVPVGTEETLLANEQWVAARAERVNPLCAALSHAFSGSEDDQEELIKLLIHRGANLNAVGRVVSFGFIFEGRPLHHAASNLNHRGIDILLDAGADPFSVDDEGASFVGIYLERCWYRFAIRKSRLISVPIETIDHAKALWLDEFKNDAEAAPDLVRASTWFTSLGFKGRP
jgi:hypothetical protein